MEEFEDSALTSSFASSSMSTTSDGSMNCFTHAVSSIKKASSSEKKYFNCTLQFGINECSRAVCFSSEKQSELMAIVTLKSPVKIRNYKKSQGFKGKDEVILQRFTKFTPLEKTDVNFSYNKFLSSVGRIPSISALEKLALMQLVTIKIHVVEVPNVKQCTTQSNVSLKRQDVLVADPTSSVKIGLWEDNVNSLEEGKTYILENLRLKKIYDSRYLNTAKGEEFKSKVTTDFEESVVVPDQPLSMETTIAACKVIGVLEATKQLCCASCSRKVECLPNSYLGQCSGSKMCQLRTMYNSQWYLRVMVQDTASAKTKVTLTLFNLQVEHLCSAMDLKVNLAACTEEMLFETILTSAKVVSVYYNMATHKVTDIVKQNKINIY